MCSQLYREHGSIESKRYPSKTTVELKPNLFQMFSAGMCKKKIYRISKQRRTKKLSQ